MKLSANEQAVTSGLQWTVMGIITSVVIFGDVMFIKLMWSHFPDGLLRIGALGGALATAASILVLLLGKQRWFRPGGQLIAAYWFTVIEVAVSILNVLYASGVQEGIMSYWKDLSPATPFVALAGWALILQLDRSTQERHKDMEMEDEIRASNREFLIQQHEAGMEVRRKALEYNKQYMLEALDSPHQQQSIQRGAEQLTLSAIQQLTGRYLAPPEKTVHSSLVPASTPASQSGSVAHAISPTPIRRSTATQSVPPVREPDVTRPSSESAKTPLLGGLLGWVNSILQPAATQSAPTQQKQAAPAPLPKKQLPQLRPAVHDRKLARLQKLRGQTGGDAQLPLA